VDTVTTRCHHAGRPITKDLSALFDLIATVLAWFYSLVPNYAVAIAMLTILVMLILTPLTLKSTKSMLEMQRIQPEMKRIQQENRGDRQAMNEAVMALYKEHGVNPLGGCLPLIIQMPIWFIMFRVLRGITYKSAASEPFFAPKYLKHDSQLYIDLSHSTQMKAFGLNLADSAAQSLKHSFVTALPYLVLVAVVVVTYFVQQRQITARNKGNPVNDTPQAAQQQMIMKIFPVFSGFFAFIVPAALAWYFLVQNIFRIGQQAYITKRFYHAHPDAVITTTGRPVSSAGGAKARPAKGLPPKASPPAKGVAKSSKNQKALPPKPTPSKAGGVTDGANADVVDDRPTNPAPNGSAKPKPTPSANGGRRAPKPPPRPSGSTGKPPARPRPQQRKKP
jgi:YidC/Oxa1 family membrane protein insertase